MTDSNLTEDDYERRARFIQKQVGKYMAAGGLLCAAVAVALPDTMVGSPRAIMAALGTGLIGAAVLLGFRQ